MKPDSGLKLQKKIEIPAGNDFSILRCRPFRVSLALRTIGFAGPGIDRTVRNQIITVKSVTALENQAVRSLAEDKCRRFGFFNPVKDFLMIQSGTFPKVGQQMARYEFAVAGAGMIFIRRFVYEKQFLHDASWVDALNDRYDGRGNTGLRLLNTRDPVKQCHLSGKSTRDSMRNEHFADFQKAAEGCFP